MPSGAALGHAGQHFSGNRIDDGQALLTFFRNDQVGLLREDCWSNEKDGKQRSRSTNRLHVEPPENWNEDYGTSLLHAREGLGEPAWMAYPPLCSRANCSRANLLMRGPRVVGAGAP